MKELESILSYAMCPIIALLSYLCLSTLAKYCEKSALSDWRKGNKKESDEA